jgi:hypothetical protein
MLMLKRASASRPSGEWSDDDSPLGITRIAHRHTGYAATREDAMAAFAKSWRRDAKTH